MSFTWTLTDLSAVDGESTVPPVAPSHDLQNYTREPFYPKTPFLLDATIGGASNEDGLPQYVHPSLLRGTSRLPLPAFPLDIFGHDLMANDLSWPSSETFNVGGFQVAAYASAPVQPPHHPTNGNGNDNRVSHTQAFSGSVEPIIVSLPPKKRKLVAPEIIAGGDAPEAVSRPNKRQRGPVAEGKARIIKRKYTVHVDGAGIVSS